MIIKSIDDYVISQVKHLRVLYIGAGNDIGGAAAGFLKCCGHAELCIGVTKDHDPALRQQSLSHCLYADLNEDFMLRDRLSVGINLIVMTEVLEHLQSPVKTLRRLAQQFPGVRYLMSTPNCLSIGRVILAAAYPHRYHWQDKRHMLLYNEDTLLQTFEAAGQKPAVVHPYEQRWWLRPVTQLRREFASGYIVEGTFIDTFSQGDAYVN